MQLDVKACYVAYRFCGEIPCSQLNSSL